MRNLIRTLVVLLILVLLVSACAPAKPAAKKGGEIHIGALYDQTGPTSDVGQDYAMGVQEAIAYVNDTGGINGKKIVLHGYDYGYDKSKAATLYAQMKDQDKVIAILGWGTGDTEALRPSITEDKIPYVSASYSAHLTDPKEARYNFFNSSDYSTNARAALTAWYDEIWLKSDKYKARRDAGDKPRLVNFYALEHPYANAPIKALKEHAQMLGFEIGPDQNVGLGDTEATTQVLAAKDFKPDVCWHGNTTKSVSATVRDAVDNKLGCDWIINNWGFDENLVDILGDKAEAVNVAGVAPCAFYGEDVPMMDKVQEYAKKLHPKAKKRLIRTVQAWGNVLMLAEALKRADKAGDLSGDGILTKGFETLKDFDVGLGFAPVTYTSSDHRGAHAPRVYVIRNGKFKLLEQVDLKARWPDKWDSWIGY
jgi:branched-chain amino acid transport system substrate-binding protein